MKASSQLLCYSYYTLLQCISLSYYAMKAIPVSLSAQELQVLNKCCLNEQVNESMSEQTTVFP